MNPCPPNPLRAAFEEFLMDKRTYVRRLEFIVELADALKPEGILLVGHQRPAADALNSATVLADTQRRLLLKFESLILRTDWDARLLDPFTHWRALRTYGCLPTARRHGKEGQSGATRLLGRYQSEVNRIVLPENVKLTLVNALPAFGLAAPRVRAYQDFLGVSSLRNPFAQVDMTVVVTRECRGSSFAKVPASCQRTGSPGSSTGRRRSYGP